MKPNTSDVESEPGTSEKSLIERATLAHSASTRRTQSSPDGRTVQKNQNRASEGSLIAHATLTASGHPSGPRVSKSLGQSPGLGLFTGLESVDHDDDVFNVREDSESVDQLEGLSTRSTCGSDPPHTCDEETNGRSDTEEKDVDTVQTKGILDSPDGAVVFDKPLCDKKPTIPRLLIDHVIDEHRELDERFQDGYRAPRGSMVDTMMLQRVQSGQELACKDRTNGLTDTVDLPTDVHFDEVVSGIAREITINDFELLQKIFIHRDGVNDCLDIDHDSPITFFRKLQRWRLLSRDNLDLLQETLMLLNKPALHARAVQYTRHNWQTVFFYPESVICPPGFDKLKLYKSACDFTRFRRMDIEAMRSALSTVLFLPRQSIYVVGIEPALAGGVVVTWLLPEHLVEVMEDQADSGIPLLNQLGVYCIEIGGTTIDVRGPYTSSSGLDLDHGQFLTVHRQLRENTSKLQERDLEVAKLRREVEFLRLELETMGTELQLLTERSAKDNLEYTKAVTKLRAVGQKALHTAGSPELPLSVGSVPPARLPIHGKPSAVIEAISRPLATRRSRSVERSTTRTVQLGKMSRESSRTFTRHSFRSTVTKHTRQTEEFLFDMGRKYKRLHGRDELFEEIEHIIHELGGIREPM